MEQDNKVISIGIVLQSCAMALHNNRAVAARPKQFNKSNNSLYYGLGMDLV